MGGSQTTCGRVKGWGCHHIASPSGSFSEASPKPSQTPRPPTSSCSFLRNSISSIRDSILRSSSRRDRVASSTSFVDGDGVSRERRALQAKEGPGLPFCLEGMKLPPLTHRCPPGDAAGGADGVVGLTWPPLTLRKSTRLCSASSRLRDSSSNLTGGQSGEDSELPGHLPALEPRPAPRPHLLLQLSWF